jgi:hypothetical protein
MTVGALIAPAGSPASRPMTIASTNLVESERDIPRKTASSLLTAMLGKK